MSVAFQQMLGLASSDAELYALDEVWAKLCRSSITPTPMAFTKMSLSRRGKASGSLSPPESHCSVLGRSPLPEHCSRTVLAYPSRRKHTRDVASALHEPWGSKRQSWFDGLGGSLAADASRSP